MPIRPTKGNEINVYTYHNMEWIWLLFPSVECWNEIVKGECSAEMIQQMVYEQYIQKNSKNR